MAATILVADGDPLAGARLEDALAGEDFRVRQVSSFEDALHLGDKLIPDIIFYDLSLPGVTGEEACRRFRALPLLFRTVLIITGARENWDSGFDPFAAPADDFILKPYSQTGLAARLRGNLLRRGEMAKVSDSAEVFTREYPTRLHSDMIASVEQVLCDLSRFKQLQRCSVALVRPDEPSAYVLASSDASRISGLRLDLDHYPELQEVIRTGQPLLVADIARSQLMAGVRGRLAGQPFKAILVMPLVANQEVLGAMVFRSESEAAFAAEEIFFCHMVALMLTRALQNAQSFDKFSSDYEQLRRAKETLAIRLQHQQQQKNTGTAGQLHFLQVAAQKLRAPVTAIHGFCNLALEGEAEHRLSAEQKDYLDKAVDCSERLVRMMTDIIDLFRLQTGDIALDLQPRDLGLVLRTVSDDFVAAYRARGVSLRLEFAQGVTRVHFDAEQIRRVLSNLLSNALQFCEPGDEVRVRLQKTETTIQGHVQDTACGIDPGRIEEMFEEFDRPEDPCGIDRGSGLGLALCQTIIQAHGGRMRVVRERRGSNFFFSLPT